MPTFTGVCAWQDLPTKLTQLAESTGYYQGNLTFTNSTVTYSKNVVQGLQAAFLPYYPYNSSKNFYPVQYLLKIAPEYVVLAVQGIYQVDTSARTHLVYVGRLWTPDYAPPAYATATTMGTANLTATLSDSRRVSVSSTYSLYQVQIPASPNVQSSFTLAPIYIYRPDEHWRGYFYDLYIATIQPQTMLNGETITGPDGSKYTLLNPPLTLDGYYNNFLAATDTNKWLVIRQ